MDSSSSRHDFSLVRQALNLVKQLLVTGEVEVPLSHLNVRLSSHAAHHSVQRRLSWRGLLIAPHPWVPASSQGGGFKDKSSSIPPNPMSEVCGSSG